jgi:DNA-binding transcriptional regulator GbsR (MarR family)
MCGMSEVTLTYLVADLARRIKKYDEALHMLARVLISRETNDRLKERAKDLKEKIREETKKKN